MPRSGGDSAKLGHLYEQAWIVDAAINVLKGDFLAITVEPYGEDGLGVEFYVERPDHSLEFHSVKRQREQGDWTIAALTRVDKTGRSVLGDLLAKRRKYPNSELRFISTTGTSP